MSLYENARPSDPDQIPIVTVYRSEQSYEMLSQMYEDSQKDVDLNKPHSPLSRVITNIAGFVLLNAVTFVVTDLMRGAFTGKRPGLWWFFYGPWYFITGAPLINNIVDMHRFFEEMKDRDHDVRATPEEIAEHQSHCWSEYNKENQECCNENNGEWNSTTNTCSNFDTFGGGFSGNERNYSDCVNKNTEMLNYCYTFNTDEQYNRALKMHDEHPLIFDMFYLFNFGELPPFVDLPWPL